MKKNIYYLDVLRALAIILVVNIHVASPTEYLFNTSKIEFLIGTSLNLVSRWSVPVFFMISGALLLGKKESVNVFFKKRFGKILIPSFFWAFIFITWINVGSFDVKKYLIGIASGDVFYHYWFIYTIVGLYLVTPILRNFIANSNKRDIEYLLLLSFICTTGTVIMIKMWEFPLGVNLQYVGGYLGYFVIGYYLVNYEVPLKIRKIMYILSIPLFFLSIYMTFVFTKNNGGNVDYFFFDYFNPITVVLSTTIFLLFKNMTFKKESKTLISISNYSFGIFLIHPLLIEFLYSEMFYRTFGFVINHTLFNTFWGIITTDISVIIICLVVIKTLKLIPILKRVV